MKVNHKQLLFSLFWLCLLTVAMATLQCGGEKPKPRDNITCAELKSIKIGMTPEQVVAILGPPSGEDIKVGVVHWMYMFEGGTWIIKIRENKVADSTPLLGNC